MITRTQVARRLAHDATGHVYRRYRERALKVAMSMLRDEDDADDAVQDAFLRALRHEHRLHELVDPYPWLHRIVTNVCIDRIRRRRLAADSAKDPAVRVRLRPHVVGPGQAYDASIIRAALEQGIGELSETHRQVIVMREIEGLAYQEIARRCHRPRGTIMSRLFYARERLRDFVGERLEHEPAAA